MIHQYINNGYNIVLDVNSGSVHVVDPVVYDAVAVVSELVPELDVVSDHIFKKSKSSALTSEAFTAFIQENGITEFYLAGADAAACIKSTCFNLAKRGYCVHVLSDCITSYDKKKLPELLAYYESKGCSVKTLPETIQAL